MTVSGRGRHTRHWTKMAGNSTVLGPSSDAILPCTLMASNVWMTGILGACLLARAGKPLRGGSQVRGTGGGQQVPGDTGAQMAEHTW